MMDYLTYKTLHVLGGFLLFTSLGGLMLSALSTGKPAEGKARKLAAMTHGIALAVILISGFGLLAKLQIPHDWLFPPWVWAKLVVWLLMGGVIVLIRKRPEWLRALWILLPLLGGVAAYLAFYKPSFF